MTPPITAPLGHNTAYSPGAWMPEAPVDALELQRAYTLIEAQRRRISELEAIATTDELTGLANRRGLTDIIRKENERIVRGQSLGAMLVTIDLDDFKSINDTFGHEAGDAVLKAVGATLLGFIRTTDHASRTGGDEFLLLLTHTTPAHVARRIQLLEQFLSGLSVKWGKRTLSINASIGYAPLDGKNSVEGLIQNSDKAMYAAKSARKSQSRSKALTPSTKPVSERIMA